MLSRSIRWSCAGRGSISKQQLQPWRRPGVSATLFRRNYATTQAIDDEGGQHSLPSKRRTRVPTPDHVLCGSVLAQVGANKITPADLLATINFDHPGIRQSIRRPSHNKLFGVFLFTKDFANSATDEDFIRDAITRVLGGTTNLSERSSLPPLQVELLVACVDAIPGPGFTCMKVPTWADRRDVCLNLAEYKGRSIIADAMKASPVHDHGAEGFAYCIAGHEQQIPFETVEDEAPGEDGPRNTKNMTPQTQGTISFVIKDLRTASPASRTIKLPLAKTIFHNGYPHTMHSSSWIENNVTERFELVQQQTHEHASATIPLEVLTEDRPLLAKRWSITTPLIPLTPPREVTASMGNIIRQIGGVDVPASHELETAVVEFFEDNDMPVQSAAVWALVIPKETAAQMEAEGTLNLMHMDKERERQKTIVPFGSDENQPRDVFSSVPYLLMLKGARLHKVLSGGGGWGKKAGLLSLDPESDYSSIDPTSPGRNLDLDGLINEPTPVREVASPGDFIRFYIYPNLPEEAFPSIARDARVRGNARVQGLEFGALPSTMDDIESSSADSASNQEHVPLTKLYERQFGGLSEGGMSVEITDDDGNQTTLSKVDVPYARFSYQHYAYPYSKSFLEEDYAREEEKAKHALAKAAIQKEKANTVSSAKQEASINVSTAKEDTSHNKKNNLIRKLSRKIAKLKSQSEPVKRASIRSVMTDRSIALEERYSSHGIAAHTTKDSTDAFTPYEYDPYSSDAIAAPNAEDTPEGTVAILKDIRNLLSLLNQAEKGVSIPSVVTDRSISAEEKLSPDAIAASTTKDSTDASTPQDSQKTLQNKLAKGASVRRVTTNRSAALEEQLKLDDITALTTKIAKLISQFGPAKGTTTRSVITNRNNAEEQLSPDAIVAPMTKDVTDASTPHGPPKSLGNIRKVVPKVAANKIWRRMNYDDVATLQESEQERAIDAHAAHRSGNSDAAGSGSASEPKE